MTTKTRQYNLLAVIALLLLVPACDFNQKAELSRKAKQQLSLAEARTAYRLAHGAQKETEKALILAEGVITTYPDFAEAYVLKAKIQLELNLHERALASLDKAIELAPDLADAHLDRGLNLAALHRQQHAQVAYAKARELYTVRLNKKPWDLDPKLNLALISHLQGNTKSALDQVNLLLASDGADSQAAVQLKQVLEAEMAGASNGPWSVITP